MAERYPPKLKFQVALELLKGDKIPSQVARAYNVHPKSYVKGQGENDVVYLIKALSQLWHYRFIALPGTDAREKQDSISPLFSCVSAIGFGFYSL